MARQCKLYIYIYKRYTYLRAVFIPSGAVYAAEEQLAAKCSRAWFAVSNILFQHKRMSVDRCLKLVDSVVFPVGMYASEFLAPLSLTKSSFNSRDSLLRSWEGYKLEIVNQRVCRLILSVHKKTSRLAVLGELGRYPVLLKSLHQSLMYDYSIRKHQSGSILGLAVAEMASSGQDSWLTRVRSVQKLLDIPVFSTHHSEAFVSNQINSKLKSIFESFYLDEINKIKLADDNINHNKLQFYSTFKGCFKTEPYISLINNRNQRKWISRLRTLSHRLEVETGQYHGIPFQERIWEYCKSDPENTQGSLGTKAHFLVNCVTFSDERMCLFRRLSLLIPNFY